MTPVDLHEPDWRRLPGYRDVQERDWRDSRWQLKHAIKSTADLKAALGAHAPDHLLAAIDDDQRRFATMRLLVPPQVLNVMNERDLTADPIRRYMLPAATDRDPLWPSHPMAHRDSLHEVLMSPIEGLVRRYPTKALVEIVTTCPQYCGHCTRMDLVGGDTATVRKARFAQAADVRRAEMLARIRTDPTIRDVVISGGDVANVPPEPLAAFVGALLDIEHVRDIRLASKALITLPQHFLRDDLNHVLARLATVADRRGVELSLHTHANHAASITGLVGEAVRRLRDLGLRSLRNQAVLLKGVNATAEDQLRLADSLLQTNRIVPYYAYLCDMIPNAEHWRIPLHEAQSIAAALMGRLPGYATPTVVCDVPGAGKRPVHMVAQYDRALGISSWEKDFRTPLDATEQPSSTNYHYYDPLHALPPEGVEHWTRHLGARDRSVA